MNKNVKNVFFYIYGYNNSWLSRIRTTDDEFS